MWQNSIPIHDYKWKNSQFLSYSIEKIPVLLHRVLFPISLLFYSHHFHFGHQMHGGFSPITKEFGWSSNTFATWCKQPTRWKRPWHWQRLKAEGEEGDGRWDDGMALPMQWTWTWANSRRWWRTGKPGVLQSMGLWRIRHDLATEQRQQPRNSQTPEGCPRIQLNSGVEQETASDSTG